ncbi:hypothetical protein D3C80_899310 [compost metagenome]
MTAPPPPLRITRAPGAASPRTRTPPDDCEVTLVMRGVAIQSPSAASPEPGPVPVSGWPGAPHAESAAPSARLKLIRRPILRFILSRIAIGCLSR